MGIWINGIDVSNPPFNFRIIEGSPLSGIFRQLDEPVVLEGSGSESGGESKEEVMTKSLCINCGEEIKSVGPETWHVESTMIRCNIPGNDGELVMWSTKKANSNKEHK